MPSYNYGSFAIKIRTPGTVEEPPEVVGRLHGGPPLRVPPDGGRARGGVGVLRLPVQGALRPPALPQPKLGANVKEEQGCGRNLMFFNKIFERKKIKNS